MRRLFATVLLAMSLGLAACTGASTTTPAPADSVPAASASPKPDKFISNLTGKGYSVTPGSLAWDAADQHYSYNTRIDHCSVEIDSTHTGFEIDQVGGEEDPRSPLRLSSINNIRKDDLEIAIRRNRSKLYC